MTIEGKKTHLLLPVGAQLTRRRKTRCGMSIIPEHDKFLTAQGTLLVATEDREKVDCSRCLRLM